jgi:hypothetical protein
VYVHWYFVLIHYLGALFCYWLCRDLGRSRGASLLAGTAFGITGWMGTTDWPQMVNGGSWAPVVFLFLLRSVRGERPVLNAGLSGAALGMAFLSGHHQIPIFITLAASGVWLYYYFSRKTGRKVVLGAAAMFGIFLFLVGAFQTLPAYEYGRLSNRWVGAKEPVGWNTPVPYTVHTNYSLYPSTLFGIVLPGIQRTSNPYVGFAVIALALLAIAGEWRERMVRIFGALALGGLVFACGAYAVLHGVLYALIPMVEKARSASMAVFIFHFGVIVLSAYAIDHYLHVPEVWTRRVIAGVTGTCALVAAIMLALNMTHIEKGLDFDRIAAACFYGLLLAGVLYGWKRENISSRAAIVLLTLILLLESGLENGFSWASRERPSEYLKKMSENTDVVEFLRKQPGFVRIELDDQEVPYNFGDWHGIDVFGGYLASLTANTNRILGDYRARMLLGVNFWVGKKPLRENQVELRTAASGLKIYANQEAFPKTWTVHEAVGSKAADSLNNLQKYSLPELRRMAFVTGEAPKLEKCAAPDWATVARRDPNRVLIEVDMSCIGMLIVNDVYYPGWVATIDGKPAQIHEAYGIVRGVVVEAGRHEVEMRYRPKSVYAGAWLTGLGWLGACVLGWMLKRDRVERTGH